MEKIKVNMSPNPLDVQTIHASQNDGEARQWEFELHNNGELIDTSNVTEQMFFKSYKGGTEQLLPENGSTPTTSPFLGDIRYPQGLLTDQEFTYRQSPTEEDGLAKITDIKGNTLVWNQLCRTLESGNWALVGAGSGTLTFADGVATFSTTNNYGRFLYTPGNLVNGHKYLLSVEIKAYVNASINYVLGSQASYGSQGCICSTGTISDANWHRYTSIGTFTSGTDDKVLVQNNSGASNLHEIQVRNIMYFDLTKMGLDSITSTSEFTSLFPLSYYSYNQGSLLSFNGSGIKTVGKNLIEPSFVDDTIQGVSYKYNADGSITCSGHSTANSSQFALQPNRSTSIVRGAYYFLNGGNDQVRLRITTFDSSGTVVRRNNTSTTTGNLRMMFNDDEVEYNVTAYPASANADINCTVYPQFEISYDKTSREPYTSSTTNLPISTYFPTGMKSAGDVYDELTPTKAITRVGAVDLGTLNWTYSSTTGHLYFNSNDINTLVKKASAPSTYANIVCQKYNVINENEAYSNRKVGIGITTNGSVRVYDPTYTNVADFKTAMSGVYLYYELATSTETSFTTASLVTENAEIPLSNNDGTLIGKCTEELSAEPGFIDAKIKLADADGECYSNKIQLHIERSPQ